ncbi:Efflux pump atB [Paramyrothecium foliicola]|nr:Efflux pump atB [Paramyrothecium foliicola]
MKAPGVEQPASDLDVGEKQAVEDASPHNHSTDESLSRRSQDDGVRIELRLGPEALLQDFSLARYLGSMRDGHDYSGIDDHDERERRKFHSPFSWSMPRKILVLSGAFIAAMLAAYSAGAYALAASDLRSQWNLSDIEFNCGITIFVTSFAFAPVLLAPFSETYGRYWVFVASGVVFFLGTVGCAVTDSFAGMLVSRLIVGIGASVFATVTGGVVGDLFRKEDRNTPMALFSASIFGGTGLGPLVSGVAVDRLGWRWIFYLQLIAIGATTLATILFFKETRSNVILQRKCAALNKRNRGVLVSGRQVCFRPQVEERKISLGVIWGNFIFPLRLLVTESVVFWFSAWLSFGWSILYMQFSSIGITFRTVYNFDNTQVGIVYTAVAVGALAATVLAIVQDPLARRFWPSRMATAEGRLILPCLQSILLPVGLFWFGWTSKPGVSSVSPTIAIGACTMGIFSIYLAVFNYLADVYGPYASSALATQSMCRNLLAGVFPLFTNSMIRNLGFNGAGSLLGGISLLLTVIPWILTIYGERIRARSPFAGKLVES